MARLALLSTSDKTGLVEFARTLVEQFEFDIISSGGTAKTLQAAGLPVTKVSDYTGFPEILGGRVKTLHPRIHGGILARRDLPEDIEALDSHDMRPIDLVVVNLYPFEQTIAGPDVTLSEAIEQIDIGGPTLLRAAAKNHAHLTVLCNSEQYSNYLQQLQQENGNVSLEFRQACALSAFRHTAAYDRAISAYLTQQQATEDTPLPPTYTLSGTQRQALRYGENPHQPAAWYQTGTIASGWTAGKILQGKPLSYNNLVDLEAARRIITEFPDEPAAAVLKHTNPCGISVASSLSVAYQQAFAADSISAFGGIVAFNQTIDAATATALTKTFLECIVAPDCSTEAAEILQKKQNLRVLIVPDLLTGPTETVKAIAGGFLVQQADDAVEDPNSWEVATEKQPTPEQLAELAFAWKVAKHVKSNAIVVTRNRTTVGVGAGQMNRVGAAEIALKQAGDKTQGATFASDGFFPFDDTVKTAAAAGIEAIVQPGGSIRDKDSIQAANELGLIMVLTGMRHFLH
ncbi:MAG: bifunctional phosphoribosylaminoimidazolecarboxamide formyltransferase/IMP cyclohydrolase [Microcoleaceae cyanobacterium]